MLDPDDRQAFLNQPQTHDDTPVTIPYLRLTKTATLLDAYQQGHLAYDEIARYAVDYLHALALEAIGQQQVPSSQQAWTHLEAAPWPMPGPPRPQPDI